MLPLLIFVLLTPAFAFNTANLRELITSRNLRSVDEVIPLLPSELRQSFTLQYQGAGLQDANKENPRAILFGKDGKFIITFNGDSTQRMGDDLEILEFNDHKQGFELHHISFDSGKVSYDRDLSKCVQCHTAAANSNPFPIWGRYPSWRGSFGSLDDMVFGREESPFLAFKSHMPSHPRYRHLEPAAGSPVSPYSTEKVQTITFRPNSNLGSYLARLNAKSLAAQIKLQKDFEKYLLLLSPSFYHCKLKMGPEMLSALEAKLGVAFAAKKIQRPYPQLAHSELENVSAFLGSSSIAFGQLSSGIVDPVGNISAQTALSDPYFLDVFYLFTPNYVLAELSAPFFARYPELRKDYDVISIFKKIGGNRRLNQTPRDSEILKTYDQLGMPLYLKEEKCSTFLTTLAKEFKL